MCTTGVAAEEGDNSVQEKKLGEELELEGLSAELKGPEEEAGFAKLPEDAAEEAEEAKKLEEEEEHEGEGWAAELKGPEEEARSAKLPEEEAEGAGEGGAGQTPLLKQHEERSRPTPQKKPIWWNRVGIYSGPTKSPPGPVKELHGRKVAGVQGLIQKKECQCKCCRWCLQKKWNDTMAALDSDSEEAGEKLATKPRKALWRLSSKGGDEEEAERLAFCEGLSVLDDVD